MTLHDSPPRSGSGAGMRLAVVGVGSRRLSLLRILETHSLENLKLEAAGVNPDAESLRTPPNAASIPPTITNGFSNSRAPN